HRAIADLARNRHVTAHHARELAGDGQAQPRAAEVLSGRGIGVAELLLTMGWCLEPHMWGATPCIKIEPNPEGYTNSPDADYTIGIKIFPALHQNLSRL